MKKMLQACLITLLVLANGVVMAGCGCYTKGNNEKCDCRGCTDIKKHNACCSNQAISPGCRVTVADTRLDCFFMRFVGVQDNF